MSRRLGRVGSVGRHLSKNRVDETGHALPALVSSELHGVVDDGVGRHTTEVQQLIHPRAQHGADPIVDLDGSGGVALHRRVEVWQHAQRAVDDLGGKGSVYATCTGSSELRIEGRGGPCAIVRHSIKDVHPDPSCLGNHRRSLLGLGRQARRLETPGAA